MDASEGGDSCTPLSFHLLLALRSLSPYLHRAAPSLPPHWSDQRIPIPGMDALQSKSSNPNHFLGSVSISAFEVARSKRLWPRRRPLNADWTAMIRCLSMQSRGAQDQSSLTRTARRFFTIVTVIMNGSCVAVGVLVGL